MFALLAVLFFVIPIIELAVILFVGREIGALPTIGLLVLSGVVGAWLAKREGAGAWRRFNKALNEARIPTTEIADGAMVLFAGALMLAPGFLTDVVGILLLLPPTRAVARRIILREVARRAARRVAGGGRGSGRRGDGRGYVDGHSEVAPRTKVTWGEAEPLDERIPPPADRS
jgi:UPF0716 protein FxsA